MDPLAHINPYAALKQEDRMRTIYQPLPARATRFLSNKGYIRTDDGKKILCFEMIVQIIAPDMQPYCALSYTWDHPISGKVDDNFDRAVQCNGQMLPIGSNLNDALQELFIHSQDSPTLFWVDAICVDQSNILERQQQVEMMAIIYGLALRVIVWLGLDDADAHIAHEFLKDYVPILPKVIRKLHAANSGPFWHLDKANFYNDSALHEEFGISPKSLEHWWSLTRFFSRRWFRRIWVIQEVAYPALRLVCCGSLRFKWEEMDLFVSLLFLSRWSGPLPFDMRQEMRYTGGIFSLYGAMTHVVRTAELKSLNLPEVMTPEESVAHLAHYCLIRTSSLESTDPRDKLFAVSSFINFWAGRLAVESPWPRPNYAIQIEDLFKTTLSMLICETKSLDLLSYVTDESARGPSSVPTWIPHLHVQVPYSLEEGCIIALLGSPSFHAGSLSKLLLTSSEVVIDIDISTLRVTGFAVDSVVEVVRFSDGNDLLALLKICLNSPATYIKTGESAVEAFWRTIVANHGPTSFPASLETERDFAEFIKVLLIKHGVSCLRLGNREVLADLLKLMDSIQRHCPHPGIPSANELAKILFAVIEEMKENPEAVERMLSSRIDHKFPALIMPVASRRPVKSLCRTAKGYLGLFPYSAQVGDEAWVFKGAKVFHLLRRLDDGGEHHKLMGEAYIHGLMQGEALKDPHPTWTTAVIL